MKNIIKGFAALAMLYVAYISYNEWVAKVHLATGQYSVDDMNTEIASMKRSQAISDAVSSLPIPQSMYSKGLTEDQIIEEQALEVYKETLKHRLPHYKESDLRVPDSIKGPLLQCVASVKPKLSLAPEKFAEYYNKAQSDVMLKTMSQVESVALAGNLFTLMDVADKCAKTALDNPTALATAMPIFADSSGASWKYELHKTEATLTGASDDEILVERNCKTYASNETGTWRQQGEGFVISLPSRTITFARGKPFPEEVCAPMALGKRSEQPQEEEEESAASPAEPDIAQGSPQVQCYRTDADDNKYECVRNDSGITMKSGSTVLYLGKSCDASSPTYGKGIWQIFPQQGFGLHFHSKNIWFPKQTPPMDYEACHETLAGVR